MANIILTERCNKNCSYCFAKDKSDNSDMTFEQAKFIIDTLWGREYFKLLGGEPTIAKEFKNVVDYLVYKIQEGCEDPLKDDFVSSFLVISNMLFSQDTQDFLCEYLRYGAPINFLANATELDVNNRINLFEKNVNAALDAGCEELCFSITVDDSKPLDYHLNYINWISSLFPRIRLYRLSAPYPDGNTRVNPIGNLGLGEKIYSIFKFLIEKDKRPHIDCLTLPCMYTQEQYGYIRSFSETRAICRLGSGALDIYPDGHCIRCYPSSSIKTPATKDPEVLLSARDIIAEQCMNIENPYFQICADCTYHKLNLCNGPCFGYITCKECKESSCLSK